MEKLFQIDTYKGRRVFSPEPNTIIVERVGGQPICFRFQKVIRGWEIELRVSIAGLGPNDEWQYLDHAPLDGPSKREFWSSLYRLKTVQASDKWSELYIAYRQVFGTDLP